VAEIDETNAPKVTKARKPKVEAPAVPLAVAAPVTEAAESVVSAATSTADAIEPAVTAAADAMTVSPADVAEAIEAVTSPATQSDPIPGPARVAAPFSEGLMHMATIASPAEATEKAQAMFGEFSGRAKAAFEKSTKLSEELVDFSKGNVEAMIASAKVAATAAQSLGQEAADYGKKNFETATAAFKSFATVKSPTELFQLQSEYAKASFDSAVAEASKISEAMMKFAGDIAQPLSNRYALAAEKIKSATAV
jgi:phasin family protein